jgi:hypothetical protein
MDGRRRASLVLETLSTFGTSRGRVEDACVTGGTEPHKQNAAFGTYLGASSHRKLATGTAKRQCQLARGTNVVLFVIIQGMTTAGAVDLPTRRADPIVEIDARFAGWTADRVRTFPDWIGSGED